MLCRPHGRYLLSLAIDPLERALIGVNAALWAFLLVLIAATCALPTQAQDRQAPDRVEERYWPPVRNGKFPAGTTNIRDAGYMLFSNEHLVHILYDGQCSIRDAQEAR